MSSEVFSDTPEIDADPSFLLALGAVQTRFDQAVAIHQASDYPHMLIGGHPNVQDPLGVFILVDSYNRLTHGDAEVLKIGVPLIEPDPEAPEGLLWLPGKEYFVLTLQGGGRELTQIASAETFDDLISQPESGLTVAGLVEKILGFQLIPIAVDE